MIGRNGRKSQNFLGRCRVWLEDQLGRYLLDIVVDEVEKPRPNQSNTEICYNHSSAMNRTTESQIMTEIRTSDGAIEPDPGRRMQAAFELSTEVLKLQAAMQAALMGGME
jgi:hypothetical protein